MIWCVKWTENGFKLLPVLFLWSHQDQRLVGVSSLCLHLSVRGDAHLVSFSLPSKAVLVHDRTGFFYISSLFFCSLFLHCVSAGQRGLCIRSSEVNFLHSLFIKVRIWNGRWRAGVKILHFSQIERHWLIWALSKNTSLPWVYAECQVFPSAASLPGFVQFLQYYYQSGCLYRLRALGERNQLDLTVGAFACACVCAHTWVGAHAESIWTVAPPLAASLSRTVIGSKLKIQLCCQSSLQLLSRCVKFAWVAAE